MSSTADRSRVVRPEVAYGEVELHLSADVDFPARFGQKVKAVGGRYGDVRGSARTRFVHVPASETGLIDEIARADFQPWMKSLTVVARKLSAEGYGDSRIGSVAGVAHAVVYKWRGEDKDGPLSAFLSEAFEAKMESIDWRPNLARWKAEDDVQAARERRAALDHEVASLREKIALEAVRIEQGANDIEPLKELARRYREVCAEAGIELEAEPASSFGMG
jgi:hypothetical protein